MASGGKVPGILNLGTTPDMEKLLIAPSPFRTLELVRELVCNIYLYMYCKIKSSQS